MNMKIVKRHLMAGVAVSTLVLMGCNEANNKSAAVEAAPELTSLEQRLSYVIGLDMANRFKQDDIGIDVASLSQALNDIQAGTEPRLSEEEIRATLQTFREKQEAKQKEAVAVVADANAKEGASFLAENAKKEGVVTLESGLQYKVITAADGAKPTTDDTVSVHYRGTLIDGTEFDSSYKRGQPVSFPVTGVIAGWTEALQLMPEGSKWELYIPSDLAYGSGGTGAQIGPNATLIFEVELLSASAE